MSPLRVFAAALTATVLLTRLLLHSRRTSSPTIAGFRLHHWMYGVVLLLVGLAVGAAPLAGVGAGLFLDEATFLALGGNSHEVYVSRASVVGTVVLVAVADATCWALS